MSEKPRPRVDVKDFNEILTNIVKLEDNHTYILKVPNQETAQQITNVWNAMVDRPKIRLMLVPSDTYVYKSINPVKPVINTEGKIKN